MSANYDSSELLLLCESIFEDGELSGDEVYRLSDWLNAHREACFHWPGNLLVQPLQQAWEDGKLTKIEMRTIGRLLCRIQKEWNEARAEEIRDLAADFATEAALAFDLSIAALPLIPYASTVRSESEPGLRYE